MYTSCILYRIHVHHTIQCDVHVPAGLGFPGQFSAMSDQLELVSDTEIGIERERETGHERRKNRARERIREG